MPGKASSRRTHIRKAQEKQAAKKAAKKATCSIISAEPAEPDAMTSITIPTVTEDDLLSFQFSHFGDDGKPEAWFIDAETALGYDPTLQDDVVEEEEEEDLGYYEDGVKRTLTDQQIEMFRHSELHQLEHAERLRREEEAEAGPVTGAGEASPNSTAQASPPAERRSSKDSRSTSTPSIGAKRKRKKEEKVPYAERNKRKWEDFVEAEDPVHGAMTQNRLLRELDDRKAETVELDY